MSFLPLNKGPSLYTFLFILGVSTPLFSQVTNQTKPKYQGDCVNGYGVVHYEDGDKYEGFFKDGKRNGPGRYDNADGSYYIGNWESDRKEYYGYYHWTNLDDYFGFFHNDRINGNGVFRQSGIGYSGYYSENGEVKNSSGLGENDRTTGCVAGDCSNGFGKYVYSKDGFGKSCYFIGFFLEGRKQHGIQVEENRDTYMGLFEEHYDRWVRSEFGIENNSDGRTYFGEYKEGSHDGLGVIKSGVFTEPTPGVFENGRLVVDLSINN